MIPSALYSPPELTDAERQAELDEALAAGIVAEQPSERERRAHRKARLIDCPRCHGEGEIGVRGLSHNPNCGFPTPDPQCDTTARCPDCHGDGVVRPDDFDNDQNERRPMEADGAQTHEEQAS